MRLRRRLRHLTVGSLTVVDDSGRPAVTISVVHGGGVVAVRLATDASTGVDLVALPDPDGGDQPLLGVHQVVAGEGVRHAG
jgi:hypothetical protein